MSEAKKSKKRGDDKSYSKFMSKHDVERAKARKAPEVGAKRSRKKASVKRMFTMTTRTIVASAVLAGGVGLVNKYTNFKIDMSTAEAFNAAIKKGKRFSITLIKKYTKR